MEKFFITIITIICITIFSGFVFLIYIYKNGVNKDFSHNNSMQNNLKYVKKEKDVFYVYKDNQLLNTFKNFQNAEKYGSKIKNSYITKNNEKQAIWDNYVPFRVVVDNDKSLYEFQTFKGVIEFAKKYKKSYVYKSSTGELMLALEGEKKDEYKILDVPLIKQMPQLERGCEVTSLAMIINYNNIAVDKIKLAEEIKKDTTLFSIVDGIVHFGNPNIGFVGDIYSIINPGLGVYNAPVYDLLKKYFPYNSENLTGINFDNLLTIINMDVPVWVITNTSFEPLTDDKFEIWETSLGQIKVTYKEHSVVITGYDENYIYFNDPLGDEFYKPRELFIKAWEQMGQQALAIIK